MDIDIQSDAHNSGEGVGSATKDTDSTANSDDSYGEVDDDAAASVSSFEAAEDEDTEDEDTSYEASEPGPEAQLQRELEQSEDAEHNLPLQLGLHLLNSFSCNGHTDSYEQHQDAQEEENHWSLEDLNRSTQHLPDILGSPDILPHNSEHRQRLYDWAQLFEGRSNEQQSSANESSLGSDSDSSNNAPPATVCLACSEQPARTNMVQYDIDSTIGFAQSLAFARQGLNWNFAPQFHQNLRTNVHLTLPVIDHSSGRARTKHVPLFKVPHIRLGRVVGAEGLDVYIFFPAQWNPEKPTNFPGKLGGRSYGVLEQWNNSILLPSLASCISSDVAQHLPPSLALALLRATVQNHVRQARTSRQGSLHQSLHHLVQGHMLDALWEEIVRRCQLPENALFAQPRLVFSSKGTKLRYKSSTIAGTLDLFQQCSRTYLNYDYLDPEQAWVDLGKEVVCTDWAFPGDFVRDHTRQPRVYLWRRCCIEHLATWIRFEQPATRTKVTRFTPAMLGDSLEATFEFGRTSTQRSNGWIYSQAYNSVKEIFDAAKVKPFRAGFLDKLTWDPDVRTMLEKRGKAVLATQKQLKCNYLSSKNWMSKALIAGETLSYGVREEHRISFAFFERMRTALDAIGKWDQPAVCTDVEVPYWQLPSETYLTHLAYNINKFSFAFEWLLGQQQSSSISYAHSMVLQMLLRALQCSFDSMDPQQTPSLWQTSYEVKRLQTQRLGMGMSQTLRGAGYAWLLGRIDWDRLVFRTEISSQIGFADLVLHDSYRRRWPAVKDAKDDLKKLEMIGHWLALYSSNEGLCSEILTFMIGFLHQVFRKDFFRSIQELVRAERLEEALDGRVMLCWDSLTDALEPEENVSYDGEWWNMKGLRLRYTNRTKVRTLRDVVDLLWDIDDGQERGRWEKYTYRVLYRRALELVRLHVGRSYEGKVHEFNKKQFVFTHWILPFPNTQRFWRSRSGCKEFVAVQHRLNTYIIVRGVEVQWEELQQGNQRYEREEQSRTKRPVGWMPAWFLANRNHGVLGQHPLMETPCEAVEIAEHLYSRWDEFERRLEAAFDEEEE
jgi:hypothetical protein